MDPDDRIRPGKKTRNLDLYLEDLIKIRLSIKTRIDQYLNMVRIRVKMGSDLIELMLPNLSLSHFALKNIVKKNSDKYKPPEIISCIALKLRVLYAQEVLSIFHTSFCFNKMD